MSYIHIVLNITPTLYEGYYIVSVNRWILTCSASNNTSSVEPKNSPPRCVVVVLHTPEISATSRCGQLTKVVNMSVVNGEANGSGLPPEGEAASSAEAPVAVDDNDDNAAGLEVRPT